MERNAIFSQILQNFGSKCYMKINEDNLGKFNARANEGIFLGYLTKIK